MPTTVGAPMYIYSIHSFKVNYHLVSEFTCWFRCTINQLDLGLSSLVPRRMLDIHRKVNKFPLGTIETPLMFSHAS